MKKILSYLSLVLLMVASLSSCVSKKKYVQAQQHIQHLQRDSAQFERQIDELEKKLADEKSDFAQYKEESDEKMSSLMSQLEAQGEKLSEKDQALQMRAERLKALQDRLQKQQSIVDQLRKTVEDALVNIKDEDLNVEVRNGKVYVSLSDKLLFPSGSANLNQEGKEAIGKLGQVLKQNQKINIDIVGHTDSIPINTSRYSDNWDLSTARATTITRLLTEEYGIPGPRLTASGMSKYNPVASNDTKEGRAKNRRTEIILTPKLQELFKILEGGGSSEPATAEVEEE